MIVRTTDFIYHDESYSRLVEHARRTRMLIYQHILTNPKKPSYAIIHFGHPRISQSLEYIVKELTEDNDLHSLLSTLNLTEASIIKHGFFGTETTLKGKHIDPRDYRPPNYSDDLDKHRRHIRELLEANSLETAFSKLGEIVSNSDLKNLYVPVMEIFYVLNRLGVMSDEMRPWEIETANDITLDDLHSDFKGLDKKSPRYRAYINKFSPFLEQLREAEVSRGLWIVSEDTPRRYNISSAPFLEDPPFLLRVTLRLRELLFRKFFRSLKHLLNSLENDYKAAVHECFSKLSEEDSWNMFTLNQLENLLKSLGNNIFESQNFGINLSLTPLLIDNQQTNFYIQSQDGVLSYNIPTNSPLQNPAYNDYIEILKLIYTYVLNDQVNYNRQGHQIFRGNERILFALHFGDPESVYKHAHYIAGAILDEEKELCQNISDSDELLLINEGHHFNDFLIDTSSDITDDYWSINIPIPDMRPFTHPEKKTLRRVEVLPPSYQKSPKRELDPIEILRNEQDFRRHKESLENQKAEDKLNEDYLNSVDDYWRDWWRRNIVSLNTPIMNNIFRSNTLERQYPGISREDWGPRNKEEEDAKKEYDLLQSNPSNFILHQNPFNRSHDPPRDPGEYIREEILYSTYSLNIRQNGPEYPVRKKNA